MRIISAIITGLVFASIALADQPPYRIGVMAPLTGDFASFGKIVRQGIEKAHNPGVEWVFEDEACEPSKAVTAYKKLTSVDRIHFVIGPCCGSSQKAVAPLLKNQKKLVLLPTAASSSVFISSGQHMYSVQYPLETEGAFIAERMNERGLKKVAIVYDDNDFSQTLEAGFRKSFKGKIVYVARTTGMQIQYLKAAVLKLKTLDFDALFIPDVAPLLLGFLTELKKLGISQRPTYSIFAAQMSDVLTSERKNAEGLLYSYPDVSDSEDAIGYFPKVAAELLADTVVNCGGSYECVEKSFKRNSAFRSDGTLDGRLILKRVRGGKFVRVDVYEGQ